MSKRGRWGDPFVSPRATCIRCGRSHTGWGLAEKDTCECGGKLLLFSPFDRLIGKKRKDKGDMKQETAYYKLSSIEVLIVVAILLVLAAVVIPGILMLAR